MATALFDMPLVRDQILHLSVEDYHRATAAGVFSRNVELLRGLLVTKMAM